MKYLNFLAFVATVMLIMTSCGKENLTTTIDNIPEVEPVVEEVVEEGTSPSYASIAATGEAALGTFVFDSITMEVNNHSLVFPSNFIGAPDVIFITAWFPTETETDIQEGTISIPDAETISQEGIDAWDAWVADGSDPDTRPDLFSPDSPYLTEYTSTITYEISNITATTVDVVVAGSITDADGNSTEVSGSFSADRYY